MSDTAVMKTAVQEHFGRLSTSGEWSRLYEVSDGRTYHFHVRRLRVLELLPERLGEVVDVGCGPGVMVDDVRKRFGTYVGVDLSPEMIHEASTRFGAMEGVSFKQGDCERLPLENDCCDQVLAMAVLEYLKSPRRALSEIFRVLRPGGIAVITVPKRWHVDCLTLKLTTPIRAIARLVGLGQGDVLPRLCLQPDELDAFAQEAGLIPDGGSQYHFTPLAYPFPRVMPAFSMRINTFFERWHATRSPMRSFFAHGFIGRYRKGSSKT